MNYMNRKLFKQRPARDKLNKMGGIMASSQPLMDTVQKFQVGGRVQPTSTTQIQNPTLADQQRRSEQALGLRIVGNLAYPLGELADLVNMPAAALQNLTNDLRYSAAGRAVGASDYGDVKPPRVTGNPARQSIIDYMDTGDFRKTGILRNLEDNSQVSEQEALKEKLESEGYNLSGDQQFSPQPSTLGSMDPAGRPRTPVETESDALVEDIVPSDMVAPGTRQVEEEGMGEGVLSGFTVITGEEPAKTRSGKTKPPPAPVTVTESGLEAIGSEIKKTTGQIASFLGDPNVSEIEKNDAVLEQFGYKSPEEEIKGLKKRGEINAEMFRDFAGVDPEEDKKIDGYNLAMMGFMIAAGDSPDALQNIAQGMAKGTKMMMDTKKARQERDRQFKMAGLDKAIRDDEKRKELAIQAYNKSQDRRFSLLTDQLRDQRQQQTVLLQLQARENMLKAELQAKAEIARQSNISDAVRAQYTADMSVLESQIEALGPAAALFTAEKGVANVVEGGFGDDFTDFISDPNKLAQAQNLAAMGGTDGPPAMTPERFAQELLTDRAWVDRNQFAAIETLQSQGIEEPTQNQIEAELKRRAAEDATNPITGGASAAPATSQTGFRVGQEVTDGQGRRATVTAVDANGNVTAVTPIQ